MIRISFNIPKTARVMTGITSDCQQQQVD